MTKPNTSMDSLSQVVREMRESFSLFRAIGPNDRESLLNDWADRLAALTPREHSEPTPAEARGEDLDAECQLHREMHLQLDSIVMGAGAFEAIHDGGQREAWGNTVASVATLARQLAEAKAEFAFQAALTKELLPYQERAILAETQLAQATARLAAVESGWKVGDRVLWTCNFGTQYPATIVSVNPATFDAELDDGFDANGVTSERFAALQPKELLK